MGQEKAILYRKLPAVDRLLVLPQVTDLLSHHPKSLVMRAIHDILDETRDMIRRGEVHDDVFLTKESVGHRVTDRVAFLSKSSLRRVVNATGVIVHTNLGRSILAERVLKKFRPLAGGYSNLEYDLEQGRRGSRHSHVEAILKELTSAEAAMVVNNNAAAVLVSLETLSKGREVVVSRGQLVEIGGSFRIPNVMRKSGATMIEVGTTNKTHLRDYEEAIGPDTALLLKVHTSNFQVVGFTEAVSTHKLVDLGKRHGVPVMEDLGSGCFVDFSKYGLPAEPTVQQVLKEGADLVTFSGDKLLGGPQGGIILGRKDLVEHIRRNQLSRALRVDKLTLLALEETLSIYRDENTAIRDIPTLRMICVHYETLKTKGKSLMRRLGKLNRAHFSFSLVDGLSKVGGGALPLMELKTCLFDLAPNGLSATTIEKWLRSYDPPIIARLEKDHVLLDMRTVRKEELPIVAEAIKTLSALP
jgi:L-seryl-tRNA(Ser) seleniumtransferase